MLKRGCRVRLVNLCDHDVRVHENMTLPIYSLPACETPARVVYSEEYYGRGLKKKIPHAVENLPEPKEGTVYVVSNAVRTHMKDRTDLASPCTKVKDKEGNVIGCRWLQTN